MLLPCQSLKAAALLHASSNIATCKRDLIFNADIMADLTDYVFNGQQDVSHMPALLPASEGGQSQWCSAASIPLSKDTV